MPTCAPPTRTGRSHETIYQALYHGGKGGLSRARTRRLRTGRPLRKRRRRAHARQVRFLAPAQLIDARPLAVEDRRRVGDWEGDLIVGRMSRSAIGTLVDRRSRYLRLVHLPDGHSADRCRHALEPVLADMPPAARLTLTWEQGSEMAHHDRLAGSGCLRPIGVKSSASGGTCWFRFPGP